MRILFVCCHGRQQGLFPFALVKISSLTQYRIMIVTAARAGSGQARIVLHHHHKSA